MGRALRIDFPGATHHVVNRGVRKQAIYLDDEDRQFFLRLLGEACTRFGLRVYAFCLMDNHYHLLLHTPEGRLSDGLQYVDGRHAQRFNTRHGVDGPLFKGRFLSKVIDSERYLAAALTYIHRNPIEAGITNDLERYRWSSYPAFVGLAKRAEWLTPEGLQLAGLDDVFELRRVTAEPLSPRSVEALSSSAAVIGDPQFVHDMLELAPRNAATEGHRRATQRRVSVEAVDRVVTDHFESHEVMPWQGRRASLERWIRVGLAQELSGLCLSDISSRYGFATANSAGTAASRYRQKVEADAAFRLDMDLLAERCRSIG